MDMDMECDGSDSEGPFLPDGGEVRQEEVVTRVVVPACHFGGNEVLDLSGTIPISGAMHCSNGMARKVLSSMFFYQTVILDFHFRFLFGFIAFCWSAN